MRPTSVALHSPSTVAVATCGKWGSQKECRRSRAVALHNVCGVTAVENAQRCYWENLIKKQRSAARVNEALLI